MYLKTLSLVNFKNHSEKLFELSDDINVFVGNNGVGKTNVLDAVHYLSQCKSFLNSVDRQNIKFDEKFFLIQGNFIKNEKQNNISCGVQFGQKKKVKKNKKAYDKLSDHIGEFPVVVVSPYDSNLISEGSEVRRKFIDSIISQYDKKYLDSLIRYNKIIVQRNALLKRFQELRIFESESIEIWDAQLIPLGEFIHQKRKLFLNEFLPIFQKYFNFISGGNEMISIDFLSQLNDNKFEELIIEAARKDSRIGYTTVGIHKDDLIFKINDNPIKKFGSQGQQKSFLIALKLTQFDYIKNLLNKKPILLLDDIFDKLDHNRVERLMEMVSDHVFGQVLITDTDKERIEKVFTNIPVEKLIFEIIDEKKG
jgi:DNA replication and repair protein RecF